MKSILALVPDRQSATVQAWLRAHPGIRVIARDRGVGYVHAVTRACPDAVQVADRWHLMENASAAFLDAVRRSMRTIRKAFGATSVDQNLLTSVEKRQYEGFQRREAVNADIRALSGAGISIKEIVRRTRHSRKVVREVVRGGRADVFRTRMSSLQPFLAQLDDAWTTGCRNGAELWKRIQAVGFAGSQRVVAEWTTRRRRTESNSTGVSPRPPSARLLARLMTTARDQLSKVDAVIVAMIEQAAPDLVKGRELLDRFKTIIRSKSNSALADWIKDATGSQMASFATGIVADQQAVANAITQPWSNGQTEGQINKLKMIKRQMYGRAQLDLLAARLCAQ